MPVVYLDSQTSCFKSTHLPYFPRVTDLEPLILRKTRDMLKMEGVWPYIVLVHIPTLGQSATEMLKGSCSFVKWTRNTSEVPSPNETEFFKHSIWHTTGSKDDDCYSLNHWSSLQVGPAQQGNAETHKLSSCNAGTLHITQLFPNIWQPGSVVALVGFSSLWTEELSFKSSFGQEAHLWNIKLFHLWRIHSGSVGPVPSEFHLVPHSHHRGTSRAENRAALLKGLRLNTTSIIQPLQGKLSCSTILPGAFGISTAKASGRGSLPVSHSWFYWLSLGANSLDTPS